MNNSPHSLRPIRFLPLQILRRSEEIHDGRLEEVIGFIAESRRWQRPIVVDCFDYIIMDGHHRFAAAVHFGLFWIPCIIYDYTEVQIVARRSGFDVSPDEIRRRAYAGCLYPSKTTRHIFPNQAWERPEGVWQSIDISLDDLVNPHLSPAHISHLQSMQLPHRPCASYKSRNILR